MFNKFVELSVFLYNSRFLFSFLCSVNLCQLNDNSRSVNMYIFALIFCLKTYTHRQKRKVRVQSSHKVPH